MKPSKTDVPSHPCLSYLEVAVCAVTVYLTNEKGPKKYATKERVCSSRENIRFKGLVHSI